MKIFQALVVAVALFIASKADAQVVRSFNAVSNATTLTVASSNLINAVELSLSPRGNGFSFSPRLAAASASSANIGFQFVVTVDGTNYNNANPIWYVLAVNGTTNVQGYTNFPATLVANAKKIKLLSITNAVGANVFLTNAYVGQIYDR